MLSNWFGQICTLDVAISYQPGIKTAPLSKDKRGPKGCVFTDGEPVSGTAVVSLKPGKKLDHQGIKAELIGQITTNEKSPPYEFYSISKDLEPPGTLFESKSLKWYFSSVDKFHESYYGTNVRLRYFVRITVIRSYGNSLSKEVDFVVQNAVLPPEITSSISMEVGIEDCLHIEFEYNSSKYHLKDVVIGKVYFLLVRIKIKHMELDIVKTETVGSGSNQLVDTEVLTKFEIMDGAAAKSECIPVRLYLSGYDLTPTFVNVHNKFSVKYFLNLVLVDEEERRYFKRQEIFLYRKKSGTH